MPAHMSYGKTEIGYQKRENIVSHKENKTSCKTPRMENKRKTSILTKWSTIQSADSAKFRFHYIFVYGCFYYFIVSVLNVFFRAKC